jgi:transcription-repair coupling factor (superfamily II helicase)
VKADMESPVPMDRLVCGDVGFGKTEVAIRAAFKAVQDSKQVAVLVPTTLLAQQHFTTFAERFEPFGVRVEVLSRFLSAAQAKRVVESLATGETDVIVGTHRLLSQDVKFKDLGLLVVDEEQRFGVVHKEAIKELATSVDVLTMTATPIPRTLEMSLTGIRDLSLLNTPPVDRQPILTYVGEYDERAVAEAIRRELLREGQVFFVHNRISDIEETAQRIREMVPEARVAVGHGQMDEATLEQVVFDFWEGRFDVFVCTTIIESGIDMPTVNTLVVDRADLLGLGQLHQLRGRVGRSSSRAYAYLFHPRDRTLSEEAYERLRTIGEATELGSGFRIAMRDLEIRGAGNLLGTGQSGHVASVGYDLYVQMVSEAIDELSGVTKAEPSEIRIELPLDAHLPTSYVSREDQRLDAYRRLSEVTSFSDVDDIAAEWADRYGPVPEAAARLLDIARVRVECLRAGVTDLVVTKSTGIGGPPLVARLSPLTLLMSKRMRLERLRKGTIVKPDVSEVFVPVKGGADLIGDLLAFFEEYVPAAEE